MSDNIKATVARRSDGEIRTVVNAQDPADLQRYEDDEHFIVEGEYDRAEYVINPATRRPNKRKKPLEVRQDVLRNQVRRRRDHLLDSSVWTTGPESPLTEACQAEWRAYRRALHALTKDVEDFSTVEFPPVPAMEFVTEEELKERDAAVAKAMTL